MQILNKGDIMLCWNNAHFVQYLVCFMFPGIHFLIRERHKFCAIISLKVDSCGHRSKLFV